MSTLFKAFGVLSMRSRGTNESTDSIFVARQEVFFSKIVCMLCLT